MAITRWKTVLACACAAALLSATTADAANITYTINRLIVGKDNSGTNSGSGTVVGQLITDGTLGTLSAANVIGWNFLLTGQKGATYSISSTTNQQFIFGAGLTATPTQLLFNFSDGGGALALFQNGLFGGQHYYCLAASAGACAQGESVVPGSAFDSDAVYMPTSGTGVIGTAGPSFQSLLDSILALIDSRTDQMIGNSMRNNQLLGGNEQVSCSDCGGANAGIGSLSLSAHGRYSLTDELTLMGGVDFGHYKEHEALVNFTAGLAGALQYDPADMGTSRPYGEIGITAATQNTDYHRAYFDGTGTSVGIGSATNYDVSVFAQAGWVDRITPRDEAGVHVGYERTWQMVGSYVEKAPGNPFGANVPSGTDTMDVGDVGAQYTTLIGHDIEVGINGSANYMLSNHSGLSATVAGVNVASNAPRFVFYEVGGRLGIRVQDNLTIDLTANAVLGPRAIGAKVHEGIGFRWAF